jgi:hypothetical protein
MFLSFQSTSPKKICNLSTQSFSEIIHVAAFVDKTLFIKAFLEADESDSSFGASPLWEINKHGHGERIPNREQKTLPRQSVKNMARAKDFF